MGLIVLKNHSYYDFKRMSAAAAASGCHINIKAHLKRSKRVNWKRAALSLAHWAAVSAVVFIAILLLFQQVGLSAALKPAPSAEAKPPIHLIAPSIQASASQTDDDLLWRCNGRTYTNAPDSKENCLLLSSPLAAADQSRIGARYITPSRPDNL